MVDDLFADQMDEATRVAIEIQQAQRTFEDRFWRAFRVGRNKANRKKHYQQLRREIGDNAAREVAKMVEAIYAGTCGYPKWFERLR